MLFARFMAMSAFIRTGFFPGSPQFQPTDPDQHTGDLPENGPRCVFQQVGGPFPKTHLPQRDVTFGDQHHSPAPLRVLCSIQCQVPQQEPASPTAKAGVGAERHRARRRR